MPGGGSSSCPAALSVIFFPSVDSRCWSLGFFFPRIFSVDAPALPVFLLVLPWVFPQKIPSGCSSSFQLPLPVSLLSLPEFFPPEDFQCWSLRVFFPQNIPSGSSSSLSQFPSYTCWKSREEPGEHFRDLSFPGNVGRDGRALERHEIPLLEEIPALGLGGNKMFGK